MGSETLIYHTTSLFPLSFSRILAFKVKTRLAGVADDATGPVASFSHQRLSLEVPLPSSPPHRGRGTLSALPKHRWICVSQRAPGPTRKGTHAVDRHRPRCVACAAARSLARPNVDWMMEQGVGCAPICGCDRAGAKNLFLQSRCSVNVIPT